MRRKPFLPPQEREDAEARARITALEEWAQRHDRDLAGLQSEFARLNADVGRLASEVSRMRSALAAEKLSAEVTRPKVGVPALKAKVAAIPALSAAPPAVQHSPPALSLDSTIISEFPAIFAEFRAKRFKLLWRGTRDGFDARDFHGRCDGHANTLTMILDTDRNIFGGFTPVEWESPLWDWEREEEDTLKGNDSLKSFLFTLKNRHNVAPRRFALKAEQSHRAITCNFRFGPCFGGDFAVNNDCNRNTGRLAQLGFTQSKTPDWTEVRFSRVPHISRSKKSKSSRLQTGQLFHTNSARLCLGIGKLKRSKTVTGSQTVVCTIVIRSGQRNRFFRLLLHFGSASCLSPARFHFQSRFKPCFEK
jgi:hypothetical protein